MTAQNIFKYFKTSPEIIRLAVMYYVRYPLGFRQVEDILHERGIDICHETVRYRVGRFGSEFGRKSDSHRLLKSNAPNVRFPTVETYTAKNYEGPLSAHSYQKSVYRVRRELTLNIAQF